MKWKNIWNPSNFQKIKNKSKNINERGEEQKESKKY